MMKYALMALAAGWAIWLAQPAGLSADEVVIRTIKPDDPSGQTEQPAEQPAEKPEATPAEQPSQPAPSDHRPGQPASRRFTSYHDMVVNVLLSRLKLPAEQAERVKPLVEAYRQAEQARSDKLREQMNQLREQANAAAKAGDREKAAALTAQMRAGYAESNKARDAASKRLADQLAGQLTAEQQKTLEDVMDSFSADPAAQARRMARFQLRSIAGDAKLSEEQEQRLMELLTKQQEQHRQKSGELNARIRSAFDAIGVAQKAGDEQAVTAAREKFQAVQKEQFEFFRQSRQAARELIDGQLTAEQKQAAEKARAERDERIIGVMVEGVTGRTDTLELDEAQKQKVNELAAAARQAMAPIDSNDWGKRREVLDTLRGDIEALLTDEQKQEYQKAQRSPFGHWGQGGRGQRRGGQAETGGQAQD